MVRLLVRVVVSEEEAVAHAFPSSLIHTKKQEKRLALADQSWADHLDDLINLSFPNISAHSQFESVCPVVEQLLFPTDRDVLKEMGNRDVATALFEQVFLLSIYLVCRKLPF